MQNQTISQHAAFVANQADHPLTPLATVLFVEYTIAAAAAVGSQLERAHARLRCEDRARAYGCCCLLLLRRAR
jgi:hypothetical protein